MSQCFILDQILEQAQNASRQGQSFLTVFDLDSTLFCVSPRSQNILRSLADDPEFQNAYPVESERLRDIEVSPEDWGIREVLKRTQIRSTLDFFEAVRNRWREEFFSNLHLHLDQPYPGAVEFLRQLAECGAHVRYLTGRDQVRMGEGTIKSLSQWGFPLKAADHLHLKPVPTRHDADFKKETLLKLKASHDEIHFFENEPVIINLVRQHIPDLSIIFMDTIHSGREQAPDDLPKLRASFLR